MINVIVVDRYSSKLCKETPETLYVFGDNTERVGMGGQAIIRQEINAIGLATKGSIGRFFSDDELEENKRVINDDIFKIREAMLNDMYTTLALPEQGLGTGLSSMQRECPRTFLFLCERLLDEFGYNNMAALRSEPVRNF
jgi:hypothetical protein